LSNHQGSHFSYLKGAPYSFFAFLGIILKNQKEKETRQYRIEHQLAMELEERRKEKD
jgi:hypothetical protein